MANIPTDPDCRWNYSFCDSGDELDEDWYSVGSIEYDPFDDLLDNDYVYVWNVWELPIAMNGWEEITQETTEHGTVDSEGNIHILPYLFLNFEKEIL